MTFGAGTTPDITITLASPVANTVSIRIFDSITAGTTTTPGVGIGKLKLVGSATGAGRVNLLIADGDQSFPNLDSAEFLRPGLTTFGGDSSTSGFVDFGDTFHDYDTDPWASADNGGTDWADTTRLGLIIADPSLRRQTVLAAVVSQDVCPGLTTTVPRGRIEVGQVLRLHAVGTIQTGGTVLNGNINAHVVAVARDQYLTYGDINDPPTPLMIGTTPAATTTGFRAIENVTAGNAIRGSVIARGRAFDDGLDTTTGNFVGVRENPRDEGTEPQFGQYPNNAAYQVALQKWRDKH